MADLPYGRCPKCLARGSHRERRPNGNDMCVNGHVYPSRDAIAEDRAVALEPPMIRVLRGIEAGRYFRRLSVEERETLAAWDALRAANFAMREHIAMTEQVAREAYEHWDGDHDSKVGKYLAALAGGEGIRVDLDKARAYRAPVSTDTVQGPTR